MAKFRPDPIAAETPITLEERLTRVEIRLRALTGKLGIVQAQTLGMLADYYGVRAEQGLGRPTPATGPATGTGESGSEQAAPAAAPSMAAIPPSSIEQNPGETNEEFANRRAYARRGMFPPAKKPPAAG